MPSSDDRLDEVSLPALLERRSWKWAAYPDDVLAAWVAEMDLPLAAPIRAALREAIDRDDLGYVPADYPRLREAFAGFAMRRLHWPVDAEQVIVVPDVMIGVTEFLRVLLEPGDGVAVTPPVYPPFFSSVEEAGCRVLEVPLAADGSLDVKGLGRAYASGTRALLLCNPHNPTGRVPLRSELVALAEQAAEYEAWVLSDEIHAPLVLPGAEHVPFLTVSPAAAERGVAFTSASKAFNLAGLKTGVAVIGGAAQRIVTGRLPSGLHYRAGHLGMLAAEAAFTHGDDWLDQLLTLLDENRRRLGTLLAEHLPELAYTPPQATFLAWLDCRPLGLGDDPAQVFLERGRVALSRGLDFGRGGAGHARLNIGTSPALLEEAVRRMAAAERGV